MITTTQSPRFTTLNTQLKKSILRLPSFQRSYEWTEANGLALFDSIFKGYPVGTIYTWETSIGANIPTKNFEGEKSIYKGSNIESEEKKVLYLIDGQQRLTTLSRVYNKDDEFDLYFDPTDGVFRPKRKKDTYYFGKKVSNYRKRNRLVSIKNIFHGSTDEETFLNSLDKKVFNQKEINNLIKLKNILDDFSLTVTEISEAPIEEVLDLYTRINKSGKQLGWVDSLATPILLNVTPNLKIEITKFIEENSKNFENFEKLLNEEFFLESIIRIINPKHFNSFSAKSIDIYTKKSIEEAFNISKKGVKNTLDLLKKLNISTEKLVKKDFSFLLLTIMLGSIENPPTHGEQKQLLRFFLLTNIFNFYSSSNAQKTKNQHLTDIKSALLNSSKSKIFEVINEINNRMAKEIKLGNKYFTGTILAGEKYTAGKSSKGFIALEYYLATRKATTFTDFDAIIDFSNAHKHHIYPTAYLKQINPDLEEDVVNNIGNITYITASTNTEFSDKSPTEYFKGSKPDEDALKAHVFPEKYSDYKNLTDANVSIFITSRRGQLAEELDEFLFDYE